MLSTAMNVGLGLLLVGLLLIFGMVLGWAFSISVSFGLFILGSILAMTGIVILASHAP